MRSAVRSHTAMLAMALITSLSSAPAEGLRLHAIFDSDMVLQRGKPITVWGWAEPNAAVSVQLGKDKADAKAAADKGRWEVILPAREASAEPETLTVASGSEKVEMGNIVVGDVWVMYGQSNMAFPLKQVTNRDTESAQAKLPNLRLFSIATNEQADPQEDIRREAIDTGGWVASSPETALEFSAIGFAFGAQIQRSLDIPIRSSKLPVPLIRYQGLWCSRLGADAAADRPWRQRRAARRLPSCRSRDFSRGTPRQGLVSWTAITLWRSPESRELKFLRV